ncbi:MAG: extracellular solute-binding protein [Oscillospiraceae bacterium]|jgi:putative aldouronate transport system substrate-binding protein|nr:extracellular solute-binding protein [Oscillospiraceae bacterium]
MKTLLVWLSVLLILMPAAALAQDTPPDAAAPERTFTLMGLEPEADRSWEGHAFFQAMRDKTGIEFTFRQYSDESAYNLAKDLAFASNDLPDAFFKAALSADEEMRYAASGQLINLAPLLAEYAPTVNGILSARPDWRSIIAQPNGTIASLPSLNGYERQAFIWINRDWLTNLNLPMPADADALEETLRAFKSGDPNLNGKSDEIPLSFVGPWEARFFLHAFGLTPNDYNIMMSLNNETNEARVIFAPFDDRYALFVEWLIDLNKVGLLDEDAFRQGQSQRQTIISEEDTATIGCFVSVAPYMLTKLEVADQYAVLPPLISDEKQAYRRLATGVSRGAFAITSACGDPGSLLEWADLLYTEEGGRLAAAGVDTVDYRWLGGGTWEWITDEMTTIDILLRDRVIRTDTITPGLDPADFQRRTDLAIEARVRREGDAIRDLLVQPFPVYWPSDMAREAEIAELQRALGQAVDEGIARFITGETTYSDETWRAFQEELRATGADRLTELFQSIYDEQAR